MPGGAQYPYRPFDEYPLYDTWCSAAYNLYDALRGIVTDDARARARDNPRTPLAREIR